MINQMTDDKEILNRCVRDGITHLAVNACNVKLLKQHFIYIIYFILYFIKIK